MALEKTIEAKLVKAVKLMGGLAPKFVSPGMDGVWIVNSKSDKNYKVRDILYSTGDR